MSSSLGAPFSVACVQNCAADDLESNLTRAEDLARQAAAAGADFICLPEYFCLIARTDSVYYEQGYEQDDHPALSRFSALAAELGRWMLLGSIPIRHEEGKVHNRSFVLSSTGEIVATYNKIHLFDVSIRDGQDYRESNAVAPGTECVIADLPWGRLGLTVCYDVRFPHLYRELAKGGAHFISIPAAFTAKTGAAHWHTLVRARAIEAGCYVFAPDQPGERPWGRRTYGHSLIVDPWGTVLAEGGDEEGFIIAEIDPDKVAEVRRMIPALTHDRPIAPPAD